MQMVTHITFSASEEWLKMTRNLVNKLKINACILKFVKSLTKVCSLAYKNKNKRAFTRNNTVLALRKTGSTSLTKLKFRAVHKQSAFAKF